MPDLHRGVAPTAVMGALDCGIRDLDSCPPDVGARAVPLDVGKDRWSAVSSWRSETVTYPPPMEARATVGHEAPRGIDLRSLRLGRRDHGMRTSDRLPRPLCLGTPGKEVGLTARCSLFSDLLHGDLDLGDEGLVVASLTSLQVDFPGRGFDPVPVSLDPVHYRRIGLIDGVVAAMVD